MSDQYEVGYGKPPKDTQFGGPRGNRPGLTKDASAALMEANEKAAVLYRDMVKDLEAKIEKARTSDDPDEFAAISELRGDVLKLLKDIMDRTVGTPKQTVDQTSSDGSMSPKDTSDAVLDALKRKHNGP